MQTATFSASFLLVYFNINTKLFLEVFIILTTMHKTYYKSGYQPQSKYRMAQRYIKNRVAQNISTNRGPMIPKTIVYKKSGEKKGMDTNLEINSGVITTTNTNGSCFVLNLIQQGAGSWNRVGRKVDLKSLRLKGSFLVTYDTNEGGGITRGNLVRMVVVWDKQPSGNTIPTFDQIFGTTDQSGTEVSGILTPPRYDNMDRFQILRDKTFESVPQTIFPSGGNYYVNHPICFDEYLKLAGKQSVYSGQSNPMTIADISTGGLYVYFRALVNDASISQINVSNLSNSRLRYID